jgi:hypothetical protein
MRRTSRQGSVWRSWAASAVVVACVAPGCSGERIAVRLEKIAGEAQSGPAGADLPQPLVVRVLDARGLGVANVPVRWTLSSGQTFPARTDRRGFARAVWILEPYSAAQHASASVEGLAQVTFTATALRTRARPARPVTPRLRAPDVVVLEPHRSLPVESLWATHPDSSTTAPLTLRGRIFSADGDPLDDLIVHATIGERTESVRVLADRFAVLLPYRAALEGIELRVESSSGTGRFLPMHLRTSSGQREIAVALIPREWRLRTGSFAGSVVAIDLRRAFAPSCRTCSSFYRYLEHAEGVLRARTAAWPEEALPLRVSFTAGDSLDAVTAADSAAFWRSADAFDRAFGADLLQPAGPLPADRTLRVAIDPRQLNSGESTTAMQAQEIFGAEITFQRHGMIAGPLGTYLVTHELLHALGFGHTCSWRSVLADTRSCPSMHADWLTPEDVAYVQLVRRVNDIERRLHARSTFDGALRAARQAN